MRHDAHAYQFQIHRAWSFKMKCKLLLAALSFVMVTGCSSIISKSEYSVAVNSTPDGANFTITNRAGQKVHSGVTPSSITLKSSAGYFKGETYTIALNKEGFAQKTYTLNSTVDGWYFGNILFGGLIGMLIVDPATGAMYNLPDRVDISLDKSTSSVEKNTLNIANINSLSSEDVARLVKL